jgi:ssDNA-binding Zn-finger/Zn-ribbon topoisomerase 1
MAIIFDCPSCGKNYRLADKYAGQRSICANAGCKKPIVVPNPQPVAATSVQSTEPNVDADALALAALADEAPKVEVQTVPIQVTCASCDHVWEVPRAMEGKNVPCPECRKINRVPVQKVEKPVDWRDTNKDRPSLAKSNVEKPSGAWDTGVTKVTGEALRATGVAKIHYEELPLWYRVRIPLAIMSVVAVVGIGIFSLTRNVKDKRQERTFEEAQESIESNPVLKDRTEFHALIRKVHGQNLIPKIQNRKQLDAAIKLLAEARANLNSGRSLNLAERQPLLMELALAQVDLGGTKDEIDLDVRLPWDKVQTEIRRTLENLSDSELRLLAIRGIASKLAPFNESSRAFDIARQLFNSPLEIGDSFGATGIEIVRQQGSEAGIAYLKAGEGSITTPTALSTAFLIAIGTPEKPYVGSTLKPLLISPDIPVTPELRWAFTEGFAFHGKWEQAKQVADQPGQAEARLRAWLAFGEQALQKQESQRITQASQSVLTLLSQEARNINNYWLLVKAARFIAQNGKLKEADQTVNLIPEDGIKSWGRLEVLRGRLGFEPTTPMETTWLDPFGDGKNPRPAYGQARIDLAKQQVQGGHRSAFRDYLKGLPSLDPGYAFAEAGLILGSADLKD